MSSPAEAYLALCKEQLWNFPREQGIQTEGNNYEGIFGPKVGHYGDDRELLQEGLDLIRSLVQKLSNGPMFAAGTGAPPVADQLAQELRKAQADFAPDDDEPGEPGEPGSTPGNPL